MDVRLQDGTIVKNVPEGMSQTELMRHLGRSAPAKDDGNAIDKWLTGKIAEYLPGIESALKAGQDIPGLRALIPADANIQGSTVGRMIQGAADLPVGVTQFAANALGAGDKINPIIAKDAATTERMRGPDAGFDWARLAGNMLNPASIGLAQGIKTAPTLAGKMVQSAGLGTLLGGGQPVATEGDFAGDKGAQMAAGGVIGGALPLIPAGVNFLTDAIKGRLPQVKAASILRDAAGPDIAAIRQANAAAPPNITSAQAAADIPRYEYAALNNAGAKIDPSPYGVLNDAQEGARMTALKSVTPEKVFEEGARRAVTKPMYEAARKAGDVVDTEPILRRVDAILSRNTGNPPLVTEMNALRKGLIAGASDVGFGPNLTRSNAERVGSIIDGLKTAKADEKNKFILEQLSAIKDDLSAAIPGHKAADAAFAARSAPVNQSAVLGKMADVLAKPGGGERVTPFLNVLGTGEEALLKRSTGYPRYAPGDLPKVLSLSQMDVVNRIAAELTRDLKVEGMASRGADKLNKVIKAHTVNYELPNVLNRPVSVYNRIVKVLSGNIDEKTMQTVSEAMLSGKSANALMDTLPSDVRKKIVDAIVKRAPGVAYAPVEATARAGMANAMNQGER